MSEVKALTVKSAKPVAEGIGGVLVGVVLLIVAVVLHAHNAHTNALCHTLGGQVAQSFSGSAYYDCAAASTAESAVGWLVVLGLGGLVVGIGRIASAIKWS